MLSDFYNFLGTLKHPTYELNGVHFQWDLEIMRKFDCFLGAPSKQLKVIHITGTNGKGSCSNFIASVLTSAGYKVGVYGSPQLLDIKERIKIDGRYIDDNYISLFYKKIQAFISANGNSKLFHSYSEIFVEMAFDYFVSQNVDVAIIEVGIGGLLDPTNIIPSPLVCIVTSLGLDHSEIFGNSLRKIADAKCGIIKQNCSVIVGNIPFELRDVFTKKATQTQSDIYFVEDYFPTISDKCRVFHNDSFDLKGPYQANNIKTVCCALQLLINRYPVLFSRLNRNNILFGLKNASKVSNFHGRWEIVCQKPLVIMDICSNTFGLEININKLIDMFRKQKYDRLIFILGLSSINHINVKNYLPSWATYYYTEAYSFLSAEDLSKEVQIPGYVCKTVEEAISLYINDSKPNDLVYIGGHIWVVSEALKHVSLFGRIIGKN